MFEGELAAKAAKFHALAAELAAMVDAESSVREAVEALPEVLAAVRQGELLTCRLAERADRTGKFALDGRRRSRQVP